jgi:hypothetical protein
LIHLPISPELSLWGLRYQGGGQLTITLSWTPKYYFRVAPSLSSSGIAFHPFENGRVVSPLRVRHLDIFRKT